MCEVQLIVDFKSSIMTQNKKVIPKSLQILSLSTTYVILLHITNIKYSD